MSIRFRWDPKKDAANLAKHRVGFDEARTVFADPLARVFPDDDHSATERGRAQRRPGSGSSNGADAVGDGRPRVTCG